MGSGEEWANDAPKRTGWCPLVAVGLLSGALITVYGAVVLITDVVKLLG